MQRLPHLNPQKNSARTNKKNTHTIQAKNKCHQIALGEKVSWDCVGPHDECLSWCRRNVRGRRGVKVGRAAIELIARRSRGRRARARGGSPQARMMHPDACMFSSRRRGKRRRGRGKEEEEKKRRRRGEEEKRRRRRGGEEEEEKKRRRRRGGEEEER